VKHQRSDLNALPVRLIHRALIHKRRMRHPSRPPIDLGVKTLDQQHLARRLPVQEVPLVALVRLHRVRLAPSIWVDQSDRNQVRVRDGVGVGDSQGVFEDGADGPPHVDDLHTAFEQVVCFGGEVVRDAIERGSVRLVDMHAPDGAAEGVAAAGCGAADGVIEDEDFGRAGAVGRVSMDQVELWQEGNEVTYASFNSCSVSL
jgi:hypothetical protein